MKPPLLSVITVCYNSEATILETMESVLEQTCENIEHVIVDGNSKDNTCSIIKSIEEKYKNKKIKLTWISEPDKGIQDAYNKATKMATGEWLIYINSGDSLYSKDILTKFAEFSRTVIAEVIYGDIMLIDHVTGRKKVRSYDMSLNLNFLLKNTICHQTIFFRRELFDKFGYYDCDYRIASDFDRLLVFFINGAKFAHMKEIVGVFVNDGVSSKNHKKTYLERIDIIIKRMGNIPLYYRVRHHLGIIKKDIFQLFKKS